MDLRADFGKRIVVHGTELPWQDSPMKGVKRRMLDRIGEEVSRATSLVSYAPGSHFSAHVHGGGEEFVVLEGVFQDEHGDYPEGAYVRNPPQSQHTPRSNPGCVIFVKLWQFDLDDTTHVRVHHHDVRTRFDSERPGVAVTPLFSDSREQVSFERWAPNTEVRLDCSLGAELLVLDGEFRDGTDLLKKYSWIRIPVGGELLALAGNNGVWVWKKTGHLPFAKPPGCDLNA